jgi:hypothetical protein
MVRSGLLRATGVALAAGALTAGTLPAHAATISDPIAEDLVTPLGLAVGSDGTFYVAEAFINQITTIGKKGARSSFTVDGSTAGVDAKGKGTLVYTVTAFPEDEESGEAPASYLYTTNPSGKSRLLASPSEYEERVNPDAGNTYGFLDLDAECAEQLPPFLLPYEGIIESNPYAVAIVPGGWLVADAAGNSVIKIGANGRISTVAVLPPVPQVVTQEIVDQAAEFGLVLPGCVVGQTYTGEPVPTDVEVGPDGHYYVSSLPGAPEAPGAGSVWRINSRTGALTQVASGFSGAVDIAVAADGTIYVAELFAGQISAIAPGGSTSVIVPPNDDPESPLEPVALEIGPKGTLYATFGLEGPGVLVSITP